MKEHNLLINPCTYVILTVFTDFSMAHCVNMQFLLTESESPFYLLFSLSGLFNLCRLFKYSIF